MTVAIPSKPGPIRLAIGITDQHRCDRCQRSVSFGKRLLELPVPDVEATLVAIRQVGFGSGLK